MKNTSNVNVQETVDKSGWPNGRWKFEYDRIQWNDEDTGLPCLVIRHNGLGHLCGYVGVYEDHPLYNKEYGDILDIHIHGGLTYASKHSSCVGHNPESPNENPENIYWFGFDCAHLGDYSPNMMISVTEREDMGRECYRSMEYVIEEVESLAKQLYSKGVEK